MQARQLRWHEDDGAVRSDAQEGLTVLIAEKDAWLTSILLQAFPRGTQIATSSLRESLNVLALHTVDIAVVDLHLTDGSGIELIEECSRLSPSTRCVMTTIHDDDHYLMPALAAGAVGYLLKDQPEMVLIQQMRLLAEGIPPLAPSIARRLVRGFMQQHAASAVARNERESSTKLIRLSQRERQVLSLIAKGMQIAAIAQLLHITTNTVCTHIKSIYRKRNVSSRAEAALEAQRLGLV
jgi:DNA-binding NarL/FixJ family response regulator